MIGKVKTLTGRDTKVKKKRKLPPWLKVVLLKFWFAGAVFFFVGWGLFINTSDQLDLALILGLVLGVVTDLLTNRILRSMERGKGQYAPFMMFPKKHYLSFVWNVLYGILLCVLVAYTYQIINTAAIRLYHLPETKVVLGAEPILFGVFCTGYDMLFLQIKKVFAKRRVENERD